MHMGMGTSGVKNSMKANPLVVLVSSSTGIQKPPKGGKAVMWPSVGEHVRVNVA